MLFRAYMNVIDVLYSHASSKSEVCSNRSIQATVLKAD